MHHNDIAVIVVPAYDRPTLVHQTPFSFLEKADSDYLLTFIQDEDPQTISLIEDSRTVLKTQTEKGSAIKSFSRDLADLTVSFKNRGVVAFDLAGAEYNYPAKKHKEAFFMVINKNMAATIHAGEAYGPESIHQALHYCKAHRIGHGTRLYEDPDLMQYVKDFRIPIEICLTSNIQTRAAPSFEEHPLRRYYDADLVLSLNTDNRLMSATTVTDEFWRAHRHQAFTWPELVDLALMAFESGFLPWEEKQAMLERVQAEVREMEAAAGG
jgi:adenosine deaminase